MRPPFSFWSCPKRECAAPGGREKGAKRAPVQWPSARRGSADRCLLRFCLAVGHAMLFCDSCSYRPVADGAEVVGVVVVLPLLLFSLPLAVPCGNVSGSGKRSRVYPCISPGQRLPQGLGVSVPDFYKGVPTFPRRRQEVCAGADRPAEHFFFSTGRGAFSFWRNQKGPPPRPARWGKEEQGSGRSFRRRRKRSLADFATTTMGERFCPAISMADSPVQWDAPIQPTTDKGYKLCM